MNLKLKMNNTYILIGGKICCYKVCMEAWEAKNWPYRKEADH